MVTGIKDFLPFTAAAGVVVGALVSNFGTYLLEKRKQAAESKRLALAFRGEIRALLELVKRRKYIETFQWFIEQMESTGNKYYPKMQIRREYFPVFTNNVGHIGLLKNPLPELIAQFYIQANSVLEDIESYRDGSLNDVGFADLVENTKEVCALFQETLSIGELIIKETEARY